MMLADIYTKPLGGFYFERLEKKIMDCGNEILKPLPKRMRKVQFVDKIVECSH